MNELAIFNLEAKATSTEDIERFEKLIEGAGEEVEPTVEEVLVDGMYMRVGYFAAGTCGTARVHLSDFINIMVSGKMLVVSEKGNVIVEGFDFFKSEAGVKKAFYIIEDTTFISIDRCDETELKEDMLPYYTVKGMSEYNKRIKQW